MVSSLKVPFTKKIKSRFENLGVVKSCPNRRTVQVVGQISSVAILKNVKNSFEWLSKIVPPFANV